MNISLRGASANVSQSLDMSKRRVSRLPHHDAVSVLKEVMHCPRVPATGSRPLARVAERASGHEGDRAAKQSSESPDGR
jgi:hypothetical protein